MRYSLDRVAEISVDGGKAKNRRRLREPLSDMHIRFGFVMLFCSLLVTGCGGRTPSNAYDAALSTATATAGDDRVLIVSDLHLDPFDRRELVDQLAAAPIERWESIFASGARAGITSSYGHDSNAALVLSAFREMKGVIPKPDYILIAGDLFAHAYYKRFTWTASANDDVAYHRFMDKTADFLTYELTKTYPHTQIFPTIGNNDGYCGDYSSRPHDEYLAHQARIYTSLIDPEDRHPDIVTSFARGGYYRAHTRSGLRILSLNSVFFAKNYVNRCGDRSEQPGWEELGWLRGVLSTDRAEPTLVLTHIPVGIDGFKTFFHLGFPEPLLKPEYQTAFLREIDAPEHGVETIVTGHLHDVGYRQTHAGAADNKPVFIAPAVSPIFGNSPAFTVASISHKGAIDALEVHRLQRATGAPDWANVMDFNSRYHLQGVNAATIARLHALEGKDRHVRALLQRDSVGNAPALAVLALNWKALWCTGDALTPQAFLACEGATPEK